MNLLGKVSLLLSMTCFLLTFGFRMALSGWIPFIGWGLGFAIFFLVFALVINIRFLIAFLKSESLHFVAKSFAMLLLTLGILFTLNFIVYKKNLLLDVTDNKIHSLSSLSQALVKALPEPLNFHYFHVGNEKVRGFEAKVREELQPYMKLSSAVHLQSHSIFQRPDLAEKFKTGNEESSLFVEYKNRIERVSDLTETAITNAILKVSKAPKTIYFVTGHEERNIFDDSTFGLKGVREQLERLHYKTGSLDSLKILPEDIAVLAIIGPRLKFTAEEISSLENYLRGGGAVLVAIDPGEEHGLGPMLSQFGIKLTEHFVVSKDKQAGQSEFLVLTHAGTSTHEIANTLVPGQNPALFIATGIEISEKLEGVNVQALLEHLPNSVGRSDLTPDSEIVKEGRQIAAAMAEGDASQYFRLAVVGDSDFMANQFYSRPGNFDFTLAILNFLSKDEDLLKLRPPVPETTYLIMTQTQMNLYFLFFVLPFALVFFLLALFFKLRRFF